MKKYYMGLIILLFVFLATGCMEMKTGKELMKENFNKIQLKNIENTFESCDLDEEKVTDVFRMNDWERGPRYLIDYDNTSFFLYMYDDNTVDSINSRTTNEKICLGKNVETSIENVAKGAFIIEAGQLGDYGKHDTMDGKEYIRYYLPIGKYEVKALRKNIKFYVETISLHKEDGYDTPDTLNTVEIKNNGEKKEIEIVEGSCLSLTEGSIIQLKKIQ